MNACTAAARILRRPLDTERVWRWWYENKLEWETRYRGVELVKNPLDLWQYAAIVAETEPDVVVETGTYHGGSALWLADQFGGRVVSIDIDTTRELPQHDRVDFVRGASSIDPATLADVREALGDGRAMVILDSDHSEPHVRAELDAYAPLVAVGCYLIVEDTNPYAYRLKRQPVGPALALASWGPERHGYAVDVSREQFRLTSHPGGYLRRER